MPWVDGANQVHRLASEPPSPTTMNGAQAIQFVAEVEFGDRVNFPVAEGVHMPPHAATDHDTQEQPQCRSHNASLFLSLRKCNVIGTRRCPSAS